MIAGTVVAAADTAVDTVVAADTAVAAADTVVAAEGFAKPSAVAVFRKRDRRVSSCKHVRHNTCRMLNQLPDVGGFRSLT